MHMLDSATLRDAQRKVCKGPPWLLDWVAMGVAHVKNSWEQCSKDVLFLISGCYRSHAACLLSLLRQAPHAPDNNTASDL